MRIACITVISISLSDFLCLFVNKYRARNSIPLLARVSYAPTVDSTCPSILWSLLRDTMPLLQRISIESLT